MAELTPVAGSGEGRSPTGVSSFRDAASFFSRCEPVQLRHSYRVPAKSWPSIRLGPLVERGCGVQEHRRGPLDEQHRSGGRDYFQAERLVGHQLGGQVVIAGPRGFQVDQLNLVNLVALKQLVRVGAAQAGGREPGG